MQTQSQTQGFAGRDADDRRLTEKGRALAAEVARRHGVGADAAAALLVALARGGGHQAQFSHPDLGGMGQWSRNGMIMVGDMFDSALKARVDALCSELSRHVGDADLFVPEPSPSWRSGGEGWWPEGCGTPSSSGSANGLRYAFFPQTHRLAVLAGGTVELFDTGDHSIHGVSSQQQNGSQDLTFTSQHGVVRLHELRPVGRSERQASKDDPVDRVPSGAGASSPSAASFATASRPASDTPVQSDPAPRPAGSSAMDDDVFAKIEKLHALQQKGVISEAEFADKKKELLARL